MDAAVDRKSISKDAERELEMFGVPKHDKGHETSLMRDVGGDTGQHKQRGQRMSGRAAATDGGPDGVGAGAEEPPPPFAPYEAEYFLSTHGDIISHDHHLNEDGEALYRFLLTHAATPPRYTVRLRGTHDEHRTRVVSYTDAQGHQRTRTEQYTVTVTDFAFALDLTCVLVPGGPAHWSVPDGAPAYRGLMVRQVTVPARAGSGGVGGDVEADEGGAGGVVDWRDRKRVTRKATKEELAKFDAEECLRTESGAAPWEAPDGKESRAPHEASRKTVREWADAYAASPKLLKEFVYEKTVYGWSTSALTAALKHTIADAPSSATAFSVDFDLTQTKIIIRPDTRLARLMSLRNKSHWWAALLWLTLVYPILWLFRRYARHGGGRWAVCGGAYALKIVEDALPGEIPSAIAFPEPTISGIPVDMLHVNGDAQRAAAFATALPSAAGTTIYNPVYLPHPNPNTPPAPNFQPSPPHLRLVARPSGGMVRITGFREGEWFRAWEPTIRRCVRARVQQEEPFIQPDTMTASDMVSPGANLDGY